MFSENKKQELIGKLNNKLSKNTTGLKCPMCSHAHFSIADAYLRNELQDDLKNVSLGGPFIPAVAIICMNCGFISQHAIGALGISPQGDDHE
ncbi:hypothetical protein [Aeromonas dhakensis]|uniref:hypothetical protein n=1 Tax=Aeromonas dhakensis TaxID=196024 RepID=UPI001F60BD0B|nr:hypothetical protein [Aeromonas dhakensis]UNU87930.1 hypothetical protein GB930_06830 [Aeromonas dhakensis]